MNIRLLSTQDAAAYQRLRLRSLQESPTAFSSSYEDEAGRTLADITARVTPAADGSVCTFGAFADAELAGFVALIHPQRKKLRHGAELAGMYVAPEYRRRGYGHALLHALIAHARSLDGVQQLKLGVNATNLAALQLYQSAGFALVGMEPDALCVDDHYYDEALYMLRFTPTC